MCVDLACDENVCSTNGAVDGHEMDWVVDKIDSFDASDWWITDLDSIELQTEIYEFAILMPSVMMLWIWKQNRKKKKKHILKFNNLNLFQFVFSIWSTPNEYLWAMFAIWYQVYHMVLLSLDWILNHSAQKPLPLSIDSGLLLFQCDDLQSLRDDWMDYWFYFFPVCKQKYRIKIQRSNKYWWFKKHLTIVRNVQCVWNAFKCAGMS